MNRTTVTTELTTTVFTGCSQPAGAGPAEGNKKIPPKTEENVGKRRFSDHATTPLIFAFLNISCILMSPGYDKESDSDTTYRFDM